MFFLGLGRVLFTKKLQERDQLTTVDVQLLYLLTIKMYTLSPIQNSRLHIIAEKRRQ